MQHPNLCPPDAASCRFANGTYLIHKLETPNCFLCLRRKYRNTQECGHCSKDTAGLAAETRSHRSEQALRVNRLRFSFYFTNPTRLPYWQVRFPEKLFRSQSSNALVFSNTPHVIGVVYSARFGCLLVSPMHHDSLHGKNVSHSSSGGLRWSNKVEYKSC